MNVPHSVLLEIRDALVAGEASLEAAYMARMGEGKFDKAAFDAVQQAAQARIAFRIYVLDEVPSVTLEAA